MNKFGIKLISIRDTWFAKEKGKENMIQKMGVEGFHIYLALFHFHVGNQEKYYTFFTSVQEIVEYVAKKRKYTSTLVKEKLIQLEKLGVIKFPNISNPYTQIEKNTFLRIEAMDAAESSMSTEERMEKNLCNVWIQGDVLGKMFHENERFSMIYALMAKFSKGGEKKCYVKIENFPDYLPISKNTVQKLIEEMNLSGYIVSVLKNPKDGKNRFYEHFIQQNENVQEKTITKNAHIMKKVAKKKNIDVAEFAQENNNIVETMKNVKDVKNENNIYTNWTGKNSLTNEDFVNAARYAYGKNPDLKLRKMIEEKAARKNMDWIAKRVAEEVEKMEKKNAEIAKMEAKIDLNLEKINNNEDEYQNFVPLEKFDYYSKKFADEKDVSAFF